MGRKIRSIPRRYFRALRRLDDDDQAELSLSPFDIESPFVIEDFQELAAGYTDSELDI